MLPLPHELALGALAIAAAFTNLICFGVTNSPALSASA